MFLILLQQFGAEIFLFPPDNCMPLHKARALKELFSEFDLRAQFLPYPKILMKKNTVYKSGLPKSCSQTP